MENLDPGTLLAIAGMLAVAGAVTGVLAGLFGVGGGAITVPILFEVFGLIGVPDTVRMPMAVGTSLAIIIPTSIQSARGHYLRGAVDMDLLRAWALPVLAGVIAGSAIARFAQPWVFQTVFVLVAGTNSIKMLFGRESWRLGDDLPGGALRRLYGLIVGLFSALMGIGGGAISNLMLTLYGRPIRQSVATSAGVGVLISIPGAIGYVLDRADDAADHPDRRAAGTYPAQTAAGGAVRPVPRRGLHPVRHPAGNVTGPVAHALPQHKARVRRDRSGHRHRGGLPGRASSCGSP